MLRLSLFAFVLLLAACGGNQTTPNADTAATATNADAPRNIIGGKKGKVGSWAYPLDTAMNNIVIGHPEGLKTVIADLADAEYLKDKTRSSIRLLNTKKTELLTILICKNGKDEWVPYSLQLTKYNDSNLPPGRKPVQLDELNYMTSNKAHIGYSEDYFSALFSEQPLTTWTKGDTAYYTHQAQPKDAKRLKLWKPEDYSGLYKFVDGKMRWIEFTVKPEALEGSK
ncbi:MAG: hypothetical protein MUC87_08515 [Bacteroidia bacterium]|jgi:hypothetical protein|nr:hypothetical protein [Bacteroidia bacterium]